MSTIETAVAQWDSLWTRGRSLAGNRYDPHREPLDLLLAVLLYQRWALDGFAESVFHDPIRDNPITIVEFAASGSDPMMDRGHVGATMHLASASLRLPTGVHRVASLCAKTADFAGLYASQGEEWPRKKAEQCLPALLGLGHCGPVPSIPVSLAMLLLFSDEFRHGEDGDEESQWRHDRKETMTSLHRCRVVQAQQHLVDWAFQAMEDH